MIEIVRIKTSQNLADILSKLTATCFKNGAIRMLEKIKRMAMKEITLIPDKAIFVKLGSAAQTTNATSRIM
jgi:hypothetical protein